MYIPQIAALVEHFHLHTTKGGKKIIFIKTKMKAKQKKEVIIISSEEESNSL